MRRRGAPAPSLRFLPRAARLQRVHGRLDVRTPTTGRLEGIDLGPLGGHHLGADSCPPTTFEVAP